MVCVISVVARTIYQLSVGITVLLAVHNGEEYLAQAIQSVLSQSCTDFELLLIDDCSSDSTRHIIRQFDDPRIRVMNNSTKIGLAASLNRGMDESDSEYVARMDHDDVMHPGRLKEQLEFLRSHTEISVCGSWVSTLGAPDHHVWKYPCDSDEIRGLLLFENPIAHPSVMFRRGDLADGGFNYDPSFKRAEDYDLWERVSHGMKLANIPRVLLKHRVYPRDSRLSLSELESQECRLIRLRQLHRLGLTPSPEDEDMHRRLSAWQFDSSPDFLRAADRWLTGLRDRNTVYPEPAFTRILVDRWFAFCNAATVNGMSTKRIYLSSELAHHRCGLSLSSLNFSLRCLTGWKRKESVA